MYHDFQNYSTVVLPYILLCHSPVSGLPNTYTQQVKHGQRKRRPHIKHYQPYIISNFKIIDLQIIDAKCMLQSSG